MKPTAATAALALATATQAARADTLTVAATPAITSRDPGGAFDGEIGTCPELAGCGSKLVRALALGQGVTAQVRRAQLDGGTYGLVIGGLGAWISAGRLAITDESCGAGHCTYETVARLEAKLERGVAWVTVWVERRRVDNDCRPASRCRGERAQVATVFGCRLGAGAACARVLPFSYDETPRVTIVGHTVIETIDHVAFAATRTPAAASDPSSAFDDAIDAPYGGTGIQ
ncbi:MAG: hypothetical protein ACM31C_04915, partial [Acidobacteriota bacterium]